MSNYDQNMRDAAFDIAEHFCRNKKRLSINQIAHLLGVSVSTARKYADGGEESGFLDWDKTYAQTSTGESRYMSTYSPSKGFLADIVLLQAPHQIHRR